MSSRVPPNPTTLSKRHRAVLEAVVRQFVLTAQPVSSLKLAGQVVNSSSATVRNIMADLESAGLLMHQHASAGRIPTALGYRIFVDGIEHPRLDDGLTGSLNRAVDESPAKGLELIDRFAGILASASKLIAVVLSPRLERGTLERIEMIPVSEERLLLVVTLLDGVVKTIVIELPVRVSTGELIGLNRLLNERLAGVKLADLQREANLRLADTGLARSELVRLILNGTDSLFGEARQSVAGTGNVIDQPEFRDPQKIKTIIELIEGGDILLHLLENDDPDVAVKIGEESGIPATRELSCISANYCVGDLTGTIGIIGPTRMDYSRQMALVGYAAALLSKSQKRK